MELVLESSFFVSFREKITNPVAPYTLVRGGNKNQPFAHPHLHLPKINPSPQGLGLHRWVCSDTLVRLKSQAGLRDSYSWSADTDFCIVTNACISRLCPSYLQNDISSYMIKSDWLQSPLNLSEPAGLN